MWKKYKVLIIVTAIICLLPILAGVILWDRLPEQIPSHWGINGEVDSWSSKPFAVFFFPTLLCGIHLLCVFASTLDPKHKNYAPQMFRLVLWICPVLSLLLNSIVYSFALGYDMLNVPMIINTLVGIMFIFVGNYLPKCRQSYTMGIKLPWTLNNEENWNKTHRFAGKLWVAGGVLILSTALWGGFGVLIGTLIVMAAVPTVYSYCLYRKQAGSARE